MESSVCVQEFKEFQIRRNSFHFPLSIVPHFYLDRPLFLGKGGYGVVGHLISHDSTRFPQIALKKFIGVFDKPKTAQRCYRELQLLSKLEHENIVKLLYAFTPDSAHESIENVYLISEYAGQDLESAIRKETLNLHFYYLKDFKNMLIQLLNALQFLNSANVIHRDLKPQNIAIKPNGKLTLLDFGLARVIDSGRDMTNNPGTVYYRAIETIPECDCRYDERADMWSLGAILCEMITGSIIFDDKHPLVKAIEICGPVGDNVLKQIKDIDLRNYLVKKSKGCQRINFTEYFKKYGRSWMKKELTKERVNLISFIDLTLQFDQTRRMTVNQALEHPFLIEKGNLLRSCIPISTLQINQAEIYGKEEKNEKEVFEEEDEMEFESNEEAIIHWRERIWNLLNGLRNPFIF